MNEKNQKLLQYLNKTTNFYPISILSFLSKVIKNIMGEQIKEYVRSHHNLRAVQVGVKGMNCMTALTDVVENLRAVPDNNMICILILLDHSKVLQVDLRLFLIMEHVLKALMLKEVSHSDQSFNLYYSAYILKIYRIL